jgi:hypothetical protein
MNAETRAAMFAVVDQLLRDMQTVIEDAHGTDRDTSQRALDAIDNKVLVARYLVDALSEDAGA